MAPDWCVRRRRRAARRPLPRASVPGLPERGLDAPLRVSSTAAPAVAGLEWLPWPGRPLKAVERAPLHPSAAWPMRSADVPRARALVDEALRRGVLVPSLLPGTTVRPIVRPKNDGVRLMADCRYVNRAFHAFRPPTLRWPSVPSIVSAIARLPGDGPLWYCTLDIDKCYDSIALPDSLRDVFRLSLPDRPHDVVAYARLPFGWSWAPYLCQRLVVEIVRQAKLPDAAVIAVYFDDILVAARSRAAAVDATNAIASVLCRAGFRISPKSRRTPAPTAAFIGFTFDRSGFAQVSSMMTAAAVRAALNGPTRPRTRARVAGAIAWCGARVGPLLRPLIDAIASPVRFVPRAAVNAAASAAALMRAEIVRPDRAAVSVSCVETLSPTSIVFVDAAAATGRAGIVRVDLPSLRVRVSSVELPPWLCQDLGVVAAQQLAELWALVSTVSECADPRRTLFVSDSTSALFSALRCRAADRRRADVLRRAVAWKGVHIAWIPSTRNPADAPSRSARARPPSRAIIRAALAAIADPPGLWPRSRLAIHGLIERHRHMVVKVPAGHVDRTYAEMKASLQARRRRSPSSARRR